MTDIGIFADIVLTNNSSPAAPLLLKTTHLGEKINVHTGKKNSVIKTGDGLRTPLTCNRGGWPDEWHGAHRTAGCSLSGQGGSAPWGE